MSQMFKIWKMGLKIIFGAKISDFYYLVVREKGREKKFKLLSSIHRVPSAGIHQAKNESSSTRPRLQMGTKNEGFHRGSRLGVREIKGFRFRKCPRDFLGLLLCSKR